MVRKTKSPKPRHPNSLDQDSLEIPPGESASEEHPTKRDPLAGSTAGWAAEREQVESLAPFTKMATDRIVLSKLVF